MLSQKDYENEMYQKTNNEVDTYLWMASGINPTMAMKCFSLHNNILTGRISGKIDRGRQKLT